MKDDTTVRREILRQSTPITGTYLVIKTKRAQDVQLLSYLDTQLTHS